MSKKRKPKTEGYTWLEFSFTAFNGSGYADRSSPDKFVESYIAYSKWKKRSQGVKLSGEFYQPLLILAEYLIENSDGPGRLPSDKNYKHFLTFINT